MDEAAPKTRDFVVSGFGGYLISFQSNGKISSSLGQVKGVRKRTST